MPRYAALAALFGVVALSFIGREVKIAYGNFEIDHVGGEAASHHCGGYVPQIDWVRFGPRNAQNAIASDLTKVDLEPCLPMQIVAVGVINTSNNGEVVALAKQEGPALHTLSSRPSIAWKYGNTSDRILVSIGASLNAQSGLLFQQRSNLCVVNKWRKFRINADVGGWGAPVVFQAKLQINRDGFRPLGAFEKNTVERNINMNPWPVRLHSGISLSDSGIGSGLAIGRCIPSYQRCPQCNPSRCGDNNQTNDSGSKRGYLIPITLGLGALGWALIMRGVCRYAYASPPNQARKFFAGVGMTITGVLCSSASLLLLLLQVF